MTIKIYDDERIEITKSQDGYHVVRIWHNGLLRLMVESQTSIFTFVRADRQVDHP